MKFGTCCVCTKTSEMYLISVYTHSSFYVKCGSDIIHIVKDSSLQAHTHNFCAWRGGTGGLSGYV